MFKQCNNLVYYADWYSIQLCSSREADKRVSSDECLPQEYILAAICICNDTSQHLPDECHTSCMPLAANDRIKRKAANIVLARLGEDMIVVVKHHLRRSYAISFDPDDDSKFSLEQLHFGLSVMLGEGSANNILPQIAEEIKTLMQEQMH
jgi:hypothetical protein